MNLHRLCHKLVNLFNVNNFLKITVKTDFIFCQLFLKRPYLQFATPA